MEGGGILTVSTSLARDGKKSEDKVVLKISDTGNGIPGDVMGKIFDPFFTTKKKGTGLGLAICNKIIADHHGSLQVESQVELGTCMVISFPAIQS
jgi:signal transduction histidine kinase